MISPLPSVSLLALPMENLPPTPPPTHSSASSSPLDCGRNEEGASTAVMNDFKKSNKRPLSAPTDISSSPKRQRMLHRSQPSSPKSDQHEEASPNIFVHPATPTRCDDTSSSVPPCDSSAAVSASFVTANVIQGSPLKLDAHSSTSSQHRESAISPAVMSPKGSNFTSDLEHLNGGNAHRAVPASSRSCDLTSVSLNELLLKILPSQADGTGLSSLIASKSEQPSLPDGARRKSQQQTPSESSADGCASPTPPRVARKLKIYSLEEKLDIVDFALAIGNRAAGREYGVAESSIREWRKNEKKYRQTVATNVDKTRIEHTCPWVMKEIDTKLLKFVDEQKDSGIDWYDIRERGREIWLDILKSGRLSNTGFSISAISFTMGWVARFMNRNEGVVANIPKPVVATTTALNNNISNVQMNLAELHSSDVDNRVQRLSDVAANGKSGITTGKRSTIHDIENGLPDQRGSHQCYAQKRAKKLPKRESPLSFFNNTVSNAQSCSPSESVHQQLLRVNAQNDAIAGTSSRRKCHPPRRLVMENDAAGTQSVNGKCNGAAPTNLSNAPESTPTADNNAAAIAALANFTKLLMSSNPQSKNVSPQKTKTPSDRKVRVSPTTDCDTRMSQQQLQSQLQQQLQQQQNTNLIYRQLIMLANSTSTAMRSGVNNIQSSAFANTVANSFPSFAIDNNTLATIQFLQNMQQFGKEDTKVSRK